MQNKAKKANASKFLLTLLTPFRYILVGFIKIIKWFSVGLFKSVMFVGEYLIDLLSYVATGIYETFKFIYKYILINFKYVGFGLYYLGRYVTIGIWTFIKFVGNVFKYIGLGIYYSFYFIFIKTFTSIYKWVAEEAKANKEARKSLASDKAKTKKSFKDYILKKYAEC